MQIPQDLRYAENHEWARIEDDAAVRVGITDYAQDSLGDIVFVDLPEPGRTVDRRRGVRRGRVDEVGLRRLRTGCRHHRGRERGVGRIRQSW